MSPCYFRLESPKLDHQPQVPPKSEGPSATQGLIGPKFFTDKPLNRLPLRVKRKYPDVFRLSQEFLDDYFGDSELSESDNEDMEVIAIVYFIDRKTLF